MELVAKYAYQVYKERSFSEAAKSLYISQPALSATISKLEKDLGMRIFDRSKIPLSLTAQGRIYIEAIEEIIEIESNMRRKIGELSEASCGSITIGGSSYASYLLMSEICGEFYKKYPGIKVTLDIGNTGKSMVLWEKLNNGEVDLLITYLDNQNNYIIEPLIKERLIIAMHKKMQGAKELEHLALTRKEIVTNMYSPEREIEDLSIFRNIEFIRYNHKTDAGRRMTQMLGDYKASHYTIKNSKHSEMHYNLMYAGIGAVVTTNLTIAQKLHDDEDILFFVPKCIESHRTVSLARTPSSNENQIIKNFIQVAKDVCSRQQFFHACNNCQRTKK